MRKVYFLFITIILVLAGCKNMSNTPTAKVENFMEKYQTMDSNVIDQLDVIIENRTDLTEEQKSFRFNSYMRRDLIDNDIFEYFIYECQLYKL